MTVKYLKQALEYMPDDMQIALDGNSDSDGLVIADNCEVINVEEVERSWAGTHIRVDNGKEVLYIS